MDNLYTLITGGSEGIGFELAKLFAKDNRNLILIARNKEKLIKARELLLENYYVDIKVIQVDLSVDNSCEKVFEFVEENNLIVDNLINNAGIGSFGYFNDEEDKFHRDIIELNIISLTKLTRYFLDEMIERKFGGILNVASTAGFIGGPKMAMYYSTKAYVLTLTEAIHDEVKEFGVKVSCLCPGPVKTNFQDKAGIKKSDKAKKYLMSPEEVAIIGYNKFLKGKTIIVPGIKNKILVCFTKFIPRGLSRKIISMTNKG